MKPKRGDKHKAVCADGKKRDVPYQYYDCKHCRWKNYMHYDEKIPYTDCDIYKTDCKHENNPFVCENWEV